ncbi:MAG: ABC transporter ATP-binding protein [Zoogloea sp.]|nr:ABC transporter ATP-binding protein [Zoogloea sp.]
MPAINVEHLALVYPGGTTAVSGLSFSVARGEIFGLLGLNGAGKTSLIKAIATLLRPAAGSVRVFGLDTQTGAAAIKRQLGVVPQENNLDTYLDARRNLLFHCRYAGLPMREAAPRVDAWLERLGLAGKAGESVLHLSGGTKRKLMLAKAFITEPRLLILDEPSAGLDPGVRDLLWDEVRRFRDGGGTVLLSTHYLEEAEALCGRIGILHQGRLAAELPGGSGALTERFRAITGEAAACA